MYNFMLELNEFVLTLYVCNRVIADLKFAVAILYENLNYTTHHITSQ